MGVNVVPLMNICFPDTLKFRPPWIIFDPVELIIGIKDGVNPFSEE